jgi:hypothetical protein
MGVASRLACADVPEVEAQRAACIKSKATPSYSFDYGLKVLEEALAIGRQADPLGPDEASSRMKEVQARATGRPLSRTGRSSQRSKSGLSQS